MEAKTHTPLPWVAAEWSCHAPTTIKAANGRVVAETSGLGSADFEADVPNAAFIVRAVNSFAAMREALDTAAFLLATASQVIKAGGAVVDRNRVTSEMLKIKPLEDTLRNAAEKARAAILEAEKGA